MTTFTVSQSESFVRTRFTWLDYFMMAYFAFTISIPGPLMPFIANKLTLNYTEIGYHFTAVAFGSLMISIFGGWIAEKFGSARLLWSGAVLCAVAMIGVVLGPAMGFTLTAMLFYGIGNGSVALVTNSTLADAHPLHATKAYSEANIMAGLAVVIGPLAIGLLARSPLGWQATAALLPIALSLIALFFGNAPFPRSLSENTSSETKAKPLPLLFWLFCMLIFLIIATEWLILSWSADFLATVVGFDPAIAAALVSVFAVAVVIGRLIGRRLLTFMSEGQLMLLALIWVLFAFPLYWLSSVQALNVLGLFLVGLGSGNLFPLGQSAAMVAAGDQTNRASARFGVFAAVATLTLPQLVGILADQFGIQRAYSVVFVVVILALCVLITANWIRRRSAA